MIQVILLSLFILFASNAFAVDVFVDNTASCPGTGATGTPYCSIQNAFTNAVAGHVIKIRTGTGIYSEAALISGKNGTAGNPIVVQPDSGASFILRNNAGPSHNSVMRVLESDYWEFRNMTFDAKGVDPGWQAIFVQCTTKNCVGIVVDGNTFRNWSSSSVDWGPNVVSINGCPAALGCSPVRLTTATVTNNTFVDNEGYQINFLRAAGTISGNTTTGVKCARQNTSDTNSGGIYPVFDSQDLIIENNVMSSFQPLSSCTKTKSAFPVVMGIWCDAGGSNITIRNNRISGINVTGTGGAIGVGIFVEAGCQGFNVYNNVLYGIFGSSASAGIVNSLHGSGVGTVNKYYGNTVSGSTYGMMTKEGVMEMKNNIFANNITAAICHGCTSGSPSTVTLTSDNNLYELVGGVAAEIGGVGNQTLAQWRTYSGQDAVTISGDPLFTNEGSDIFTLQSGSPAKSAGATLASPFNTDFTGATRTAPFSMGAYELDDAVRNRAVVIGGLQK